jgi:hypothetical protein
MDSTVIHDWSSLIGGVAGVVSSQPLPKSLEQTTEIAAERDVASSAADTTASLPTMVLLPIMAATYGSGASASLTFAVTSAG